MHLGASGKDKTFEDPIDTKNIKKKHKKNICK